MSSTAIARAALMQSAPLVAALASTTNEQARRIVVGRVQEALVPSLALREISLLDRSRSLKAGANRLVRSRVEITVVAKDVKAKEALRLLVRQAVRQSIGTFAGFAGAVVEVIGGGPELPLEGGALTQTVDVQVTYTEA